MGLVGIEEEIKKALEEEQRAKDNKATEKPNYLKSNMVSLPLEDYIKLYNSAEELAKLLSIIFSNLEKSSYRDRGVRLKNEDNLIEFIANYEPCIFQQVVNDIQREKEEEEEEE